MRVALEMIITIVNSQTSGLWGLSKFESYNGKRCGHFIFFHKVSFPRLWRWNRFIGNWSFFNRLKLFVEISSRDDITTIVTRVNILANSAPRGWGRNKLSKNKAEREKQKSNIFPVFRRFGLYFPVFLPFMTVSANVRTRYSKISIKSDFMIFVAWK